MSATDTRCAECGATFEVGPIGQCTRCTSRQVRPIRSAFDAIVQAERTRAHTRDPRAERLQARQDVLDQIEVMCVQIAANVRQIAAWDAEEQALIDSAVASLAPLRPEEIGRP